jgi:hypothetical protein
MGRKRLWPSFETPRKRAAPLAITAKPLRRDDGGARGGHGAKSAFAHPTRYSLLTPSKCRAEGYNGGFDVRGAA